ncbi:MAG: carboxypeptidase regulatory-like domain-containing protein [Acidobacteria bacterium]|nr:carboxypeptidase regulatory-like domain-containing protein [Acidobacteriota bacterium]
MTKRIAARAGLFVLAVSMLSAQSLTSITGTVTDLTGAVVPGAKIQLFDKATNAQREGQSDNEGRYAFLQVSPGLYRLLAKKDGFADVSVQDIRLLVNTPATLNLQFEKVGSVNQVIEVNASSIQLNTVDATLGNSFGTKPIVQLPLEGRRADRLLSLQPGISYIGDSDAVNGGAADATDRNGVVNGGRSDQSNITLDGVDINNQQSRDPFQGALRVTLDSVQEFRVTTTNANADSSRGSGAQITLVTRAGANEFHGAAYEYLRNKAANANTFFNNAAGLKTPKLNRNIYGGRLGGRIIKDKLFFFANYEGQRDRLEQSVTRTVPRETLRNGIVSYQNAEGGVVQVQPQQLLTLLPDARQINQAALNVLRGYPAPNDFSLGDGFNTAGFRFNSPLSRTYDTYVARLDYKPNYKNNIFVRGQLQRDVENGAPQYPGLATNFQDVNRSRGIAIGWDYTVSANLFSSFRYGYTRQIVLTEGIGTYAFTTFRGLSDPVGGTRPFQRRSPTSNINQDFTWNKGKHTVQFGGTYRNYANDRVSYANAFFGIGINSSWMTGSGNILSAPLAVTTLPASQRIAGGSRTAFHDGVAAVLGLVTQVNSRYNYLPQKDGSIKVQTPGEGVARKFVGEESELYIQDTWKATRNLTLTAGLRYMYWPAVYEANGIQTSPNIPLSEFFDKRVAAAAQGKSGLDAVGYISFNLASKGGRPLYDNIKNWSPRASLAYSPDADNAFTKFFFGGKDKSVVRAGWGMYYDVFGAGLIRSVDASSLGLSTNIQNSSGRLTLAETPRFTNLFSAPSSLVTPAPPASFPVEQPRNAFQITNGLDDRLRAPYVMRFNLSVTREIGNGFTISAAYVASEGRRTLTSEDMATPLNIVDPASGVDLYTAATQLTRLIQANTPTANIPRIPYWENMFPGAAGAGLSATQRVYNTYRDNFPDATAALESMDRFQDPSVSRLGRFAYYHPQYSYLRALRSVGSTTYHSMQWTLRKQFRNGDQVDFNWTWAHSLDLGSVTENDAPTENRGIIISPYNRSQMKASSDFDQRHSFNANGFYGLPFGKGKKFGNDVTGVVNQLIGGWQLGGIYRASTGLPMSVGHNRTWPTNYNITGWATTTGAFQDGTNKNAPSPIATTRNSGPNIFQDPQQAIKAFGFTMPGEIGNRNNVRGDGLFNIDLSLSKRFDLPFEGHSMQFRWEVFNATNSVRFDVRGANINLGQPGAFGRYSTTLVPSRVMQFGLRYEF